MSDLGVILDLIPTPEAPGVAWGVVTAVGPITVQFRGDTAGTVVSLAACDVSVGHKVTLQRVGGQWVVTGVIGASGWVEIAAFTNSWVNYGSGYNTAAYRRGAGGKVTLKGLIKSGTVESPAWTLPAGYRPAATYYLPTLSFDGTNRQTAMLEVQTDGDVVPRHGANTWFALDGLSFYAVDA